MFQTLVQYAAWLALPVALLCIVDDWFLRPGRTAAAGAEPADGPLMKVLYGLLPLLILILIYGGFALTASINIGHRHILPIYPAAFILAGGLWRRFGKWLLPAVALLLWESLSVYPHYLAFFQAAAGGPAQGYRHLVDSSLDWGQDLPWLRQWLDEHPSTQPSYFS